MKRLLTLVLFVALATGCASVRSMLPGEPEVSDSAQAISSSTTAKRLAKNRDEGERLIEKGSKLLAKSESLARESQETQAEAEDMIARGQELIKNSEASFELAFGGSDQVSR